jgi:hypothetical protein
MSSGMVEKLLKLVLPAALIAMLLTAILLPWTG